MAEFRSEQLQAIVQEEPLAVDPTGSRKKRTAAQAGVTLWSGSIPYSLEGLSRFPHKEVVTFQRLPPRRPFRQASVFGKRIPVFVSLKMRRPQTDFASSL